MIPRICKPLYPRKCYPYFSILYSAEVSCCLANYHFQSFDEGCKRSGFTLRFRTLTPNGRHRRRRRRVLRCNCGRDGSDGGGGFGLWPLFALFDLLWAKKARMSGYPRRLCLDESISYRTSTNIYEYSKARLNFP